MPPAEDELPSRWQWLDWWFTPRWRAWLTWIAVAALMDLALNLDIFSGNIYGTVDSVYDTLSRAFATPIPFVVEQVTEIVNVSFLLIWIEPIALRLSPVRGLFWLILRVLPMAVAGSVLLVTGQTRFPPPPISDHYYWLTLAIGVPACSVLMIPVLRGRRSRPWMPLVGGVLMCALYCIIDTSYIHIHKLVYAPVSPMMAIPYAALLLYGTRLLTPEERAQRQS